VAVECQDNQNISKQYFESAVKAFPGSDIDLHEYYELDLCTDDMFDRSQYIHDKAYENKPTLLLSGELDPVTLAVWAEEVTRAVPKSAHHVVNGIGHGVLFSEKCNWSLLNRYWSTSEIPKAIECGANDE
jgi:pimeloyl-ACP methyl ester carboxylesterase